MNIAIPFRPKLLGTLDKYSGQDFTANPIAVLTVSLVALPLAMAFAIESGVPPQARCSHWGHHTRPDEQALQLEKRLTAVAVR